MHKYIITLVTILICSFILSSCGIGDAALATPSDTVENNTLTDDTERSSNNSSERTTLNSINFEYGSLVEMSNSLYLMDKGTLDYIAEYEDRTDAKYYRSKKEKQNGVFNEFRNRILNEGKIEIPLIDGKELPFDENRDDNVCILVSNACARPWISFNTDLVEIRLTYLDDEIAEEANEKGCSWLKEKLEPGSRNTNNYLEYREKYIAEGWGQLATVTMTEETVMFDGKEIKALVSSYLNGTLDREVVTVWVVSGNILAAVGGFPEDVWDVIARMTFGEYRFS